MLVALITTGSINFDIALYITDSINFKTALRVIGSINFKIAPENCDNFLDSLTNKQKHHCSLYL